MAAHAQAHRRYPGLDLPSPLRAAGPLVALCVLAAALEIDPRLPWAVGVVAAICFAAAAGVRATRARMELTQMRRVADRLIVHEPRSMDAFELIRWRSDELVAPERRAALRREVEATIRSLDGSRLPSASPLRRPAARRHVDLLRALAARVGDERPVTARGLLLARSLLRDPSSTLYAEDAEALLARSLTRVLGALEP